MKKYFAEAIGTFVLVLIGCGTAALIGCDVTGGYLATAFAFGLSIVAMAYSVGNVSGCHVNPAVSTAMFVSGKLSAKDLGGYIVAQVIGALVAAGLLAAIIGRETGLGCNGLFEGSTLTLVHILGIGLTGTSVNPARSLGPAIVAGGESLAVVWVFIVAPIIGGALAAVCYKALASDAE